mmetsp:Transcript_99933/g.287198  ORF Transcript_99933/g.287198 Transcript_99933/m.287198 type:complete len:211 (-) Transcript_99933:236-868(-)
MSLKSEITPVASNVAASISLVARKATLSSVTRFESLFNNSELKSSKKVRAGNIPMNGGLSVPDIVVLSTVADEHAMRCRPAAKPPCPVLATMMPYKIRQRPITKSTPNTPLMMGLTVRLLSRQRHTRKHAVQHQINQQNKTRKPRIPAAADLMSMETLKCSFNLAAKSSSLSALFSSSRRKLVPPRAFARSRLPVSRFSITSSSLGTFLQ